MCCSNQKSKQDYLCKLGNELSDNCTGQKTHWNIINSLLNKCRIQRIPLLLIDNKIVTSCTEKATHFNNYSLPNANLRFYSQTAYLFSL